MSPTQFQTQMNRLAETFGGQHYKRERVDLLWRELAQFSDSWLIRIVDKFIGECRMAPLLAEFREEASKERERSHSIEKQRHAQEAKEFMSRLPETEMRQICKEIRRLSTGCMSDGDKSNFFESLKGLDRGRS